MSNSSRFTIVVPDVLYTRFRNRKRHLIVDTKEDTTADYGQQFLNIRINLLEVSGNWKKMFLQSYRINMGTTVEEQNSIHL